jgi:hypothetical protein
VTEDGLRVYDMQLWIFLFVTSKSKETLWLCVLVANALEPAGKREFAALQPFHVIRIAFIHYYRNL